MLSPYLMKIPSHTWKKLWVISLSISLLSALALENGRACSVPVYYYALFEWRSDSHSLILGTLPKGISETSIKDRLDHSTANLQLAPASSSVPVGHVQIRFSKTDRLWWDAPLPGNDPQKVSISYSIRQSDKISSGN